MDMYKLPAGVVLALNSNRGQLMSLYRNEVKKGLEVPLEQLDEILRLLGDMIDDNFKLRSKNERLSTLFTEFVGELDSINSKVDEHRKEVNKLINEAQEQIKE